MQLYWIQKKHIAGDNCVDAYILYAKERNDKIVESHYSHRSEEKSQNDRDDNSPPRKSLPSLKRFFNFISQFQTELAVSFGVLGFVAQFQGLHLINWTCSIAQLIALGLATILRAIVRRRMTKTPGAIQVDEDYILDILTLAILGAASNGSEFPDDNALRSPGLSFALGVADIPKLKSEDQDQPGTKEAEKRLSLAQKVLNLRVRLGYITKWKGP